MKTPAEGQPKIGPYDSQNARFRKAFIRERLAAIRAERDALIAERDRLDVALRSKVATARVLAPAG